MENFLKGYELITLSQAHSMFITAQSILATSDRQKLGVPPINDDGTDSVEPDPPIGEDLERMARSVVKITENLIQTKFELDFYKGTLPNIAPVLTEEEQVKIAQTKYFDPVIEETADFYGYTGRNYSTYISGCEKLQDLIGTNDPEVAEILALKANERAREIIRLNRKLLKIVPYNSTPSIEEILNMVKSNASYTVLLSDVKPIVKTEGSKAEQILLRRNLMRASNIMRLSSIIRKNDKKNNSENNNENIQDSLAL